MKAFKVKLTFNLSDFEWSGSPSMTWWTSSNQTKFLTAKDWLLPPTRHREFYQQPLDLNCISSLRSTMQILDLLNSINPWANFSINFSLSYPSIRGKHVIYSYIWLSGITEMQSFSFEQWVVEPWRLWSWILGIWRHPVSVVLWSTMDILSRGGADQVILLKLQTCELSKPFCFLKLSFLRYFIKAVQNGLIHGYRKYSG